MKLMKFEVKNLTACLLLITYVFSQKCYHICCSLSLIQITEKKTSSQDKSLAPKLILASRKSGVVTQRQEAPEGNRFILVITMVYIRVGNWPTLGFSAEPCLMLELQQENWMLWSNQRNALQLRCISRVLCDLAGNPQRSLFASPSLQVVAACEPGISLYDRPISFEQRNE